MTKPLLVIDTGGTMGSAVGPDGQLYHGNRSLTGSVVAEISRDLNIPVCLRSLADLDQGWQSPIDSCEMHPQHWSGLAGHIFAEEYNIAGAVVLHGTDTLAYTASALSFALGGLGVPVVVTGSQRSVHEPNSDAAPNIRLALSTAAGCQLGFRSEVMTAFGGRILRGNRSTKVSVTSAAGFASPTLKPLETGSALGHLDCWTASRPALRTRTSIAFERHVWLVDIWPGLSHRDLFRLMDAVEPKGVVFRIWGAGVAPAAADLPALAAVLGARGVPAVAISSIPGTMIDLQRYESGKALAHSSIIDGANMTVEAAVTKMMWVLAAYSDTAERHLYLAKNLAGELDNHPAILVNDRCLNEKISRG